MKTQNNLSKEISENKENKKWEMPNAFVILFILMILAMIATWFVPAGKFELYGEDGGVPDYHLKKVRYYQTAHVDNLKRALDRGVKVITGTDAGTPFNYHGDNAYELEALVEAGMSTMEAIKSATSLAAEALNLTDRGAIAKGMAADLIVINGNPLEDITILQKGAVQQVFKAGELVFSKSN